jgi:hypothetical protein
MKTSEAFPSNYLKASDIGTETWRVTIDDIKVEELSNPQTNQRQEKPVLYFRRIKKGLVLNVTNSRAIEAVYGDEMDDWIGKEIRLFTREVEARGETVQAIRVRVPKPGESTAPSHRQPRPAPAAEPSRFASGLAEEPRPAPRKPAAEHPGQYDERNPPPHPGPGQQYDREMDDEIPF